MLISELWSQLSIETRNFGAPKEQEALVFLNQAIDQVNAFLIRIKDPTLVKDISISTGMQKPDDFGELCGTFPVHFNNGAFVSDITPGPVKARYFARKPRITSMSDTFPFDDSLASLCVKWASIYAINRAEGDTANDLAILQARIKDEEQARGI